MFDVQNPDLYDMWAVVTPHDTNPLPFKPKAVAVGATAGTVVCTGQDGVDATFQFAAGQLLKIRPSKIKATGTTATPIVILR